MGVGKMTKQAVQKLMKNRIEVTVHDVNKCRSSFQVLKVDVPDSDVFINDLFVLFKHHKYKYITI